MLIRVAVSKLVRSPLLDLERTIVLQVCQPNGLEEFRTGARTDIDGKVQDVNRKDSNNDRNRVLPQMISSPPSTNRRR